MVGDKYLLSFHHLFSKPESNEKFLLTFETKTLHTPVLSIKRSWENQESFCFNISSTTNNDFIFHDFSSFTRSKVFNPSFQEFWFYILLSLVTYCCDSTQKYIHQCMDTINARTIRLSPKGIYKCIVLHSHSNKNINYPSNIISYDI